MSHTGAKAPPRLRHSYTASPSFPCSAAPALTYYLSRDGRGLVLARASGVDVSLFDARYEIVQTLSFWNAFPASSSHERNVSTGRIQAIRVRGNDRQDGTGEVFLLAALESRLVIWSASLISSSTKKWRVHSTLHLSETICSIDFHDGRLLLGVASSVQIWTLGAGANFWSKVWSRRAPDLVTHVEFNTIGSSFAASARGESRLIVWHFKRSKGMTATEPSLTVWPCEAEAGDLLGHPQDVVSFQWRGMPDSCSQPDALVSRSADGAARVWIPVIDQPSQLRLSATVARHSFGRNAGASHDTGTASLPTAVFYLDAAVMASIISVNIGLIERDLQLADVEIDGRDCNTATAVRELDLKRTRLKRLQHILSETPDTFLCFQDDGSLVVRALAYIDRRPPTLLQEFTILKLPALLPITEGQLAWVQLVPLGVQSGQSCDAPLGILSLQSHQGATLDVEINPALLFDGQGDGLVARDIGLSTIGQRGGVFTRLLRSGLDETIVAVDEQGGSSQCWPVQRKGASGKWSLRSRTRSHPVSADLLAYNAYLNLFWDHHEGRLGLEDIRTRTVVLLEGGPVSLDKITTFALDERGVSVLAYNGELFNWQLDSQTLCPVSATSDVLDVTTIITAFFAEPKNGQSRHQRDLVTVQPPGSIKVWKVPSTHERRNARTCARTIEGYVVSPTLGAVSSSGMVAIVHGDPEHRKLELWDTVAYELSAALQFSLVTDRNEILALDWRSHPHDDDLLAVATDTDVKIYARRRIFALEVAAQSVSSWIVLAYQDLTTYTTQSPRDVKWMSFGGIVVAAGQSLHLFGPDLADISSQDTKAVNLLDLAEHHHGPLPAYHPNLLIQCMLWGKLHVARRIVVDLWKAIQGLSTSGDGPIDGVPDIQVDEILIEEKVNIYASQDNKSQVTTLHANLFDTEPAENETRDAFSSELVGCAVNKLQSLKGSKHLNSEEIDHLVLIIRCLLEVTEQGRSLDKNGLRYLISLRACMNRPNDRITHADNADCQAISNAYQQPRLRHRDYVWALHSECQETLLSAIQDAFKGKLVWSSVRATGAFLWLKSHAAVAALAEQVARDQFVSTEDRDPIACSLFYYALGKNKLVLNLWRQAAWHPEQRKMLAFLANDFETERWRSAALKNAFALLSQRRFEFAACFFLLGDSLQDAVNVCIRNLRDVHLAIALARIKEARDDGPVFNSLLKDRVLPMVFEQGRRWLGHWCFWMLKMQECATSILINPIADLRDDARVIALLPSGRTETDMTTPSPRYEDVALAIFFLELKRNTLLTLKGSREISPRKEWKFVLHMNRILRRMGCHVIGLALLAGWEFDPPAKPSYQVVDTKQEDSRSSRGGNALSRGIEIGRDSFSLTGGRGSDRASDLLASLNARPALPPISPLQRRTPASRISGDAVPKSPPRTIITSPKQPHRSSLLRRRSSVINDLELGHPAHQTGADVSDGQSQHKPRERHMPFPPTESPVEEKEVPSSPAAVEIVERKDAVADSEQRDAHMTRLTTGPEDSAEEPERKPRTKGTLFRAATTAAQQGAQEFNFDNFGF